MTIEELATQGKIFAERGMAAGISSRLTDLRKSTIKNCLANFDNLEHRLEYVATVHGIEFTNDSKATNINSTWFALENARKKVVWIAGGIDNGNDYSRLTGLAREKVKALVCLGTDNTKLIHAFTGIIPVITSTLYMDEAVYTAYRLAKDGDNVILSPACASFDLFADYFERGRLFKKAVKEL